MNEPAKTSDSGDDMLTIGEVAKAFGVTVATVRNWDAAGKLAALRTPAGTRRFRRSDVDAVLRAAS